MAAPPPGGLGGQLPAVVAGLPAGLAGFLSGHPWWGLALFALVPAINAVCRDFLRPLLGACGVVLPHRVRAVGTLTTERKKDRARHRAEMARVRQHGELERERLEQRRRTREVRARTGGADVPSAGRAGQLRSVPTEEAVATPSPGEGIGTQGRHRQAG